MLLSQKKFTILNQPLFCLPTSGTMPTLGRIRHHINLYKQILMKSNYFNTLILFSRLTSFDLELRENGTEAACFDYLEVSHLLIFLCLHLKGQSNEIFAPYFFHQTNRPGPLTNGLKYFRIWYCFR